MGKITQELPNKDEIPKLKRRQRRKDLDHIHSRILKNKKKSDYEQNKYNKDRHKKQNSSKNPNKHIRLLHTGIFKNGTKSKNIKKNKDAKGKLESVVSKARLVGDVLKLFDGDSETICISESATEDEITNQLKDKPASRSNRESIKDNLTRKLSTLKKSPVIVKNQRKYRTKYSEDTPRRNKEAVILFEPIDIPEVIIDQNFLTKKTMEGTKRNEKKKEVTHSEYSTITPCNRDLNDSYMKLCARLSDEYKNILNCVEDPLSAARRKLKEISTFPRTKHIQNETIQELSNSKSSTLSEHQACVYPSDTESLTVQFSENQNSISCLPENNRHNKKISDFSINWILSMNTNSRREERCSDISIIRNKHSKMLTKKQILITTPHRELPMQFDDEKITRDCIMPNNIPQKYPKEIDRSESTNEQFYEGDFVNMFQNLPTPSTVNRQFDRLKQAEFQNNSKNQKIRTKYSERFEEPCTHLYVDVPNKEDEFIQFRNCVRSQAPLEVLTAAATFVEAGHLPQDQTGKQHMDRHIPISSNCNSVDQQPPLFYCSQNTGSSNLNIKPAKQKHCANQNTCRNEEGHIYFNCSNCSHQCNISQAYHQDYAKTARRTIASGCSYFPIHYNRVASNYINPTNNAAHTRVLPFMPNYDSYTYLQQVNDQQRMIYSQNCNQPVKYFALDNGVNVHKIPLYVKDSICECQDHGHSSICPH